MIIFEKNNYCEHCGWDLKEEENITVRDSRIYHTECLPENIYSDEYEKINRPMEV